MSSDEYQAYKKEKGLGEDDSDYKDTSGCVYKKVFEGQVLVYVDKNQGNTSLLRTIVHESVHAFDTIKSHMGIGFDEEITAYGVESVFAELMNMAKQQGADIYWKGN